MHAQSGIIKLFTRLYQAFSYKTCTGGAKLEILRFCRSDLIYTLTEHLVLAKKYMYILFSEGGKIVARGVNAQQSHIACIYIYIHVGTEY